MYADFRKLLNFYVERKLYGTLEIKTSHGKGYVLLDAGKPADVFFGSKCGSEALEELLDLVDIGEENMQICIYAREGGVR